MILDLDLSNNSFTKFLALVHDANELIEEIDCEYRERDSHRFSYRLYKIITQNDCKEFNMMLSHFLSELNLLAMRKPYSNQNILLLIDAFHTITSDIYYFEDLKDMFPDIKFIIVPEFRWGDYPEQSTHAYEELPIREQELSIDTKDFDFDDNNEHAFDMDDKSDFDFGSNSDPAAEKKSPSNNENEYKPWVKPFFTIAALALASLFIYGYFF
ncbi:hypothetical protein [Pseudomonas syringae group genomosp. 3]|uniref:Uncharacterized protein n=1 Tax=Pseudomonas syringae pv. coriandricola TaxID=264453 RepID=A0A3M3JLG7_9PSED|nr:hypothetical protein [Pseudomonas syringae group genomosp. 3]RMN10865.1 hypothetical protein ALQ65_01009 [Pseudomonas syringae pv. coriandricola]